MGGERRGASICSNRCSAPGKVRHAEAAGMRCCGRAHALRQ